MQLLNTGTCPPLPMEAVNPDSESAQVTSSRPCDSPLMGLQLEGLHNTPKPDYNTLTFQPGFNNVPQHIFQNATETNNFADGNSTEFGASSSLYSDYTVPDLVSASPERLSTNQTQNNIFPTDLSNPSSTSTTYEALGDLMDDEASNYYWKQILELVNHVSLHCQKVLLLYFIVF